MFSDCDSTEFSTIIEAGLYCYKKQKQGSATDYLKIDSCALNVKGLDNYSTGTNHTQSTSTASLHRRYMVWFTLYTCIKRIAIGATTPFSCLSNTKNCGSSET